VAAESVSQSEREPMMTETMGGGFMRQSLPAPAAVRATAVTAVTKVESSR